jgi:antibiotic biosynthesis monooxygenase (ABM) superfamily enzyme
MKQERGDGNMICRIWHGWTSRENADAYEQLLRSEIIGGIAARGLPGYRGLDLLRRDDAGLVAFVTVMWFDSLEAVQAFAGPAYRSAVVPPSAQALLVRYDREAAHYEVRERSLRG